MTDRYAVIGNPIAHSRSPWIHAAFARQTGQPIEYGAVLGELVGFEAQVDALRAGGLLGLNVTLPFKERALALAGERSPRAATAGAANTLTFTGRGVHADNTDGIGLVRDLCDRLGQDLAARRVLVLGAGGAVRGILAPLLERGPACLHLWNRTAARAAALAAAFPALDGRVGVEALGGLDARGPYDLLINGTAGSLAREALPLPAALFAAHSFAYDLAYLPGGDTPFLAQARTAGAAAGADGLGMLVEQAAEAFLRWRGVRPDTDAVLAELRASLAMTQ